MMRRRDAIAAAVALCALSAPAFGQAGDPGRVMLGEYFGTTPPTLTPGQLAHIHEDVNGYLQIDCVVGCTGGGGSSTPTGTPNDGKTASAAVPVMGFDDKALASQATLGLILNALGGGANGVLAVPLVTLGTAPAAGSSVVPTSDVADGTAISAATMPAGGQGLLGWLSAVWQAATGYLKATLYVGQTQVSATAPVPTQGVDLPIASQSSVATQTLSGTPTAATSTNSYTFQTGGMGTISLDLSGITASGAAVTFYASDSGIRFYPVNTLNGAPNNRNSSTTADGSYTFPIAGRRAIRVAITTAGSSGTLTVVGDASPSSRVVDIDSSPTAPVSDQLIAGGLVVGSMNGSTLVGLPTTDTQDGLANTAIGAATLAGNGSGLLGWLSTIAGWLSTIASDLSGYLSTQNPPQMSTTVTPTGIAASSHPAGSVLGNGYITLSGLIRPSQLATTLNGVEIAFNDAQTPSIDLLLLDAAPTSTLTDGAALSLSAADEAHRRKTVHITDCASDGTPTFCQAEALNMSIRATAQGGTLYAIPVLRTAMTPAGANDVISLRVSAYPD